MDHNVQFLSLKFLKKCHFPLAFSQEIGTVILSSVAIDNIPKVAIYTCDFFYLSRCLCRTWRGLACRKEPCPNSPQSQVHPYSHWPAVLNVQL